ncbi:MAG: tRNA 2-thiocytidine(32) synthetase TtcA [Corallococcus sp.]|nr:tRNA 2-thiocytidine(32) synthetase TtcA [Bacillota bacterium]MCM1533152.1 tRNA 2-thiocytidine(32) synthetase TtcA [Corallococcus sp.]
MNVQQLLSPFRRAVNDYNMINDGDKIAVGVSGGKDSLVLLTLMREYQKYFRCDFQLTAVTIDMGFADGVYAPVKKYCEEIGVSYSVVSTDIAEIIFDIRKEKNPCSLCAKMRRGALNGEITSKGFTKLALGHHLDDVVETFMLSLFYEGRLNTFQPKSYMSRSGVTLIRPMIYLKEKDIVGAAKTLPVVHNPCPADKHTERENMKSLLKELSKKYPDLTEKFANAIMHPERYNLWDKTEK